MQLQGKNGYNISYEESVPEGTSTIILAMHGFAGDKESSCISLLEKEANKAGIGLIKFDWPSHGESEAEGDSLTLENCLADLSSVIEYIKENYPCAKLAAFATSFGGYVTLLYHLYHDSVFDHLILRSPAIRMYNIMENVIMTEESKKDLQTQHYFFREFDRTIKITERFVDELNRNDLFELYGKTPLTNASIIHGTMDDVAPIQDSIEFAKLHGCSLYPVAGADHRYKKPGELEQVIEIASGILSETAK